MKTWQVIAYAIAFTLIAMYQARAEPSHDPTPVTQCDKLPYSATFKYFSISDTQTVCREMAKVLEGFTIGDLIDFQTSAYVFVHDGCSRDYESAAAEMVNIIRLRGLYNKRDRWQPTVDIAYRACYASHGLVTARDIAHELRDAGPELAKGLDDENFKTLLAMVVVERREGNTD